MSNTPKVNPFYKVKVSAYCIYCRHPDGIVTRIIRGSNKWNQVRCKRCNNLNWVKGILTSGDKTK